MKLHTWIRRQNWNHPKPFIFITAFALLGTILLLTSRAATPYVSLEPEQGVKSTAITTVSDPAASGNSAVQFGSGSLSTAPAVDTKVLVDPKAKNTLALLGRGRIATAGNLELLLYWEEFTWPSRIVAHVTDTMTGTTSLIDLPTTAGDWTNPVPVLTQAGDLYILAGNGPIVFRHYKLAGSPMPTSASLVSSRTFGNTDSRMGAMIQLKSGALVAVWHQHGDAGPNGHGIAYRRTDGTWQEQTLAFTQTRSSKDTLVQHPSDYSVWLFNNSDALGVLAAAHMTEANNGLRVDWHKWDFISTGDGEFDVDPEDPDITAVADPWAGDVVVAYESAHRMRFSDTVLGSWPAVARIKADGTKSFTHLPVWVERVSWLSLSVRQGEVWLLYRAINEVDLSTYNMELRVLRAGAWSEPVKLGKAGFPLATPTGASFAYDGIDDRDGKIYLTRAR